MFYTFQSALYIHPKQEESFCLVLLREMIQEINSRGDIKLIPYGKTYKKILDECDSTLLAENGNFIILKEINFIRKYGLKSININCYIINAYKSCTLIKFDPILSSIEKSISIEIYRLLKQVLAVSINVFQPVLVQLNGIGDEDQLSILNPLEWNLESPLPFFTPFNYMDKRLLTGITINELSKIADVIPYSNGYTIEFLRKYSVNEINSFLRKWSDKKGGTQYSSIMP